MILSRVPPHPGGFHSCFLLTPSCVLHVCAMHRYEGRANVIACTYGQQPHIAGAGTPLFVMQQPISLLPTVQLVPAAGLSTKPFDPLGSAFLAVTFQSHCCCASSMSHAVMARPSPASLRHRPFCSNVVRLAFDPAAGKQSHSQCVSESVGRQGCPRLGLVLCPVGDPQVQGLGLASRSLSGGAQCRTGQDRT